jgi:hypothetical protein
MTASHPVLRAWTLAWASRDPARRRAAWGLCWRLARCVYGISGAGPDGVPLSLRVWLLPPGSPYPHTEIAP